LIIGGNGCNFNVLSSTARGSITKGITEGRQGKGKGIVYVFASGNGYSKGDDTNIKGYTKSGRDGWHSCLLFDTGGVRLGHGTGWR
jgi:hypothetical protein